MNNGDYLWDRSGPPDPEVERLERLLAPLAYQAPRRRLTAGKSAIAAAIAAAVVIAAGAVWYSVRPAGPAWQVVAVAGNHHQKTIARGGTVQTDAASKLRLELDSFGEVEVEPNTRLKLLVAKTDEQRMSLTRGKIHAQIWAPPHQFYVNTPSAVTVDLGCSYSLEVDESGDSTARVDFGWVAFEDQGRESFIPAGAVCVTRKGKGPGIPHYEDAPAAMVDGLTRFDRHSDTTVLPEILANARPKDALSLWHLLRRAPVQDRGAVYDRLAQLIQVPEDVSREQAIRGDTRAIDALWNALGLGDTDWWRMWKR